MVRIIAVLAALALVSCGGGNNSTPSTPSTPTTPTTPTPQNRNPTITSVTVNPAFGVAELQAFSFAAVANDADGDPLTYTWSAGGMTSSGATPAPIVFTSAGSSGQATVTVTDSKGGSASSSVNFTVGSVSGTWIASIQNFSRLRLELQQAGGVISGRFVQMDPLPNTPQGSTGITDPAEPGKVDKDGRVEIRMKIGRFIDFYMRGTMDGTGRTITGGLFGSGFTGTPFTMVKQ
ncbi:MAG: Ig-like domain-containing protein [Vicinamibacterales bacterium]